MSRVDWVAKCLFNNVAFSLSLVKMSPLSVCRGGMVSSRVRPMMVRSVWWYWYGVFFSVVNFCTCAFMCSSLSCLFIVVTKFLWYLHLLQLKSLWDCFAILNNLSRFLICLFSSDVIHGFCFGRFVLRLIGIEATAALSISVTNSSVAAFTS